MGAVSSRPEDGVALFLRDQNRLTISSLVISSPRKRSTITITPNALPATRVTAARSSGDLGLPEFIQDVEPSALPSFLLKLGNEDDLVFTFTFVIQQEVNGSLSDCQINKLTYVHGSTSREVETLVTRELHDNINLHKNANVELVGDFTTGGSPSVSFEWAWKWKPPKELDGGSSGWRNACSFVEYDQRAHRLNTLASFSFWVASFQLAVPPKIRMASSQTVDSRLSEHDEPGSPVYFQQEAGFGVPAAPVQTQLSRESVKVDVACARPADDVTLSDDGPVFRATLKSLEQKTGNMRSQMKKVMKKAELAHEKQVEANEAFKGFMEALREASTTNANAVQPALDHYFDKIAKAILEYERQNMVNLRRIIIDPINRFYNNDIKQAESKKRDFEEESKDYYAYVSRYLGQRQDSVKSKKLVESDNKYQTKRRNFELKRFDYSSFMQDLHGGRKEQEVLSNLTKYADAQARIFLKTAKNIDAMLPQLEALSSEVQQADKDFQYQRQEREEKRRVLEKGNVQYNEPETASAAIAIAGPSTNGYQSNADSEIGRADSTGSQLKTTATGTSGNGPMGGMGGGADLSRSPGSMGQGLGNNAASQNAKFKGIRDLEERDLSQAACDKNMDHRKEGLLWALNRPGSHVDPRALTKQQGWHKSVPPPSAYVCISTDLGRFWVVLDQGKLSEYSNWKQKLDLHMEPIDLRMASVREARNAERRFCFEVITPYSKRVYQATTDEDMNSWINAINNALQSAVERGHKAMPSTPSSYGESTSLKRDIGSVLTGKSSSVNHGSNYSSPANALPSRRITVGGRPALIARPASGTFDDNPDKLLQLLRNSDQGNCWCADCGGGSKVEWVSINLAIILCIECSGIHRSLGTHISKVRSLTLDINSFTPDIIELLHLVGNRVSNMVWEARLDGSLKPSPQATRDQRLKFITAKYVDRAFVEPISATLSQFPSADDTLLAAIKRNEIQQVIYALALKGNPNVLDKSRGTHPVFLALAAADPALPTPCAISTTASDAEPRAVTFPVAELLIQNGAEIPTSLPAIPLSNNAQRYIEQKRVRTAAIEASSSLFNSTIIAGEKGQRDKESRSQKRISAGGRLAKTPIPER